MFLINFHIFLGDFEDTYRNLTLKTIAALEWFHKRYNNNAFFFKVDTDDLIDIFKLIRYINNFEYNWSQSDFIFGCINSHGYVNRYDDGYWGVSYDDYPNETFPPYAVGKNMDLSFI